LIDFCWSEKAAVMADFSQRSEQVQARQQQPAKNFCYIVRV
jgi:hypothetical protein